MHRSQALDGSEQAQRYATQLAELERKAIEETLTSVQGNREQAAKILGIGERTLYRKIKEYGIKE